MISIAPLGTGGLWAIRSTSYSPALHREAKGTPGLRFDFQARHWAGWPDAVAACAMRLREKGIRLDGLAPTKTLTVGVVAKEFLTESRKYQREAIRFLCMHAGDGALLADDVGLGKTHTALKTLAALEASDDPCSGAVVVCPSFVRGVWQKEIKKWLPKWAVIALEGTSNTCKRCKGAYEPCEACGGSNQRVDLRYNSPQTIFLMHYDIAHAWVQPLFVAFGHGGFAAIFDEIHYLQSDKSRRSHACRELARKAYYRIGLSATPMTSRPRDLWNPVDTLCPERFGRPFDFYLAHADAHRETIKTREGDRVVWNTGGASRLEELQARLNYFMLRRTKSDVRLELPPRTRQIVEVEVARKYRAEMDIALKSDAALRDALSLAADGKLEKALELIASHVETGSKAIVFTHRIIVAEQLAAALVDLKVGAKVITGEVSHKRRNVIVEERPQVICCTLDSTSVGIDLSYADVAVFVELDWVPSKLVQGEGRLHRFGQEKPVLIQYVIALGTADEVIRDAVLGKLESFEKAVGKLDDGLKQSLKGPEVNSVAQLKKLYEKMQAMEAE